MFLSTKTNAERWAEQKIEEAQYAVGMPRFAWIPTTLRDGRLIWLHKYYTIRPAVISGKLIDMRSWSENHLEQCKENVPRLMNAGCSLDLMKNGDYIVRSIV